MMLNACTIATIVVLLTTGSVHAEPRPNERTKRTSLMAQRIEMLHRVNDLRRSKGLNDVCLNT